MRWIVLSAALVATSAMAQQGKYDGFVRDSKAYLTKSFKDPGSAQYRDLVVYAIAGGKSNMLCGEVNAKNSFGAYVGFRKFMASPQEAHIREDGAEAVFDAFHPIFCERKLASVK